MRNISSKTMISGERRKVVVAENRLFGWGFFLLYFSVFSFVASAHLFLFVQRAWLAFLIWWLYGSPDKDLRRSFKWVLDFAIFIPIIAIFLLHFDLFDAIDASFHVFQQTSLFELNRFAHSRDECLQAVGVLLVEGEVDILFFCSFWEGIFLLYLV